MMYQGRQYGTGWVNDPIEVARILNHLDRTQAARPFASVAAAKLLAGPDDDQSFLAWKAEEKVRGHILPSWDQGQYGTCVSFGWGRGVNDLMLIAAASGTGSDPGKDIATEPIYGGSRVEVGNGRIAGDGSVGAWAARWVKEWGNLLRQVYGKWDLTRYSGDLSRQWGRSGVPDELEPICREHPVKTVALIEDATQAWKLLGNGYPIPICSGVGFDSPLAEGFCERSGSWGHCMLVRGRMVARFRGRRERAFIIQNSWGDYIEGEKVIFDGDGNHVELPEGCFGVHWSAMEDIIGERDSFAASDFVGFEPRDLSWYF